jgi:hypothetical protein
LVLISSNKLESHLLSLLLASTLSWFGIFRLPSPPLFHAFLPHVAFLSGSITSLNSISI